MNCGTEYTVTYSKIKDSFRFCFLQNGRAMENLSLTRRDYKVAGIDNCRYYAYEFAGDSTDESRKRFVADTRIPDSVMINENKKLFIISAVNSLDADISLPSFNWVVYPKNISELSRDMLGYLNRIVQPDFIVSMEEIINGNQKSDMSGNVLIIADISTSEATIFETLQSIQAVDEVNQIAIFSLIGDCFSEFSSLKIVPMEDVTALNTQSMPDERRSGAYSRNLSSDDFNISEIPIHSLDMAWNRYHPYTLNIDHAHPLANGIIKADSDYERQKIVRNTILTTFPIPKTHYHIEREGQGIRVTILVADYDDNIEVIEWAMKILGFINYKSEKTTPFIDRKNREWKVLEFESRNY